MALIDVANSAAIGNNVSGEVPFLAQDSVQQAVIRAGRIAIDAVISAHNGSRTAFANGSFELGQISIAQVVLVHHHVYRVASGFGPAVNGIVLGGGDGLKILGVVAL